MKATIIYRRGAPHQNRWCTAMADGLERHGITVKRCLTDDFKSDGDFSVCWGWRIGSRIPDNQPRLILERGYMHDAALGFLYAEDMQWVSAGWNGLNGRAFFPVVADGGERWQSRFSHLMRPQRMNAGSYVLLIGQVESDLSIRHVDIGQWYREMIALYKQGPLPVFFRPHPVEIERNMSYPPHGIDLLLRNTPLDEALDDAALVVTYNSNVGVDAVLAGAPVVAHDEGSMIWPLMADDADRGRWATRMAWCQWSEEEMRNGTAWAHLRDLDCCARISA